MACAVPIKIRISKYNLLKKFQNSFLFVWAYHNSKHSFA
jgi:hypothetical protein